MEETRAITWLPDYFCPLQHKVSTLAPNATPFALLFVRVRPAFFPIMWTLGRLVLLTVTLVASGGIVRYRLTFIVFFLKI